MELLLEGRQLLSSVSLSSGVLTITGNSSSANPGATLRTGPLRPIGLARFEKIGSVSTFSPLACTSVLA